MEALVHVDERKWPDRLHWQFSALRLGRDEHGVWLYTPAKSIVQRGYEPPRELPADLVICVPVGEWWLLEFYWDHPRFEVYVNIGTPPEWIGDRVTQIDLDLDVIRTVDGVIEVVDEDEFAQHQAVYGYPPELIASTRTAANRAVQMLRDCAEPFGDVASRWIEVARDG